MGGARGGIEGGVMEQRSQEWFAARAGKFTASRAGDLMATTRSGPSASRANLITTLAVERLTGQCVETYTNAAMQRGVELEDEARDAYAWERGVAVEQTGFVVYGELPNTGCSPDGLVETEGMVEIKCPASMQRHLDALRSGDHAREYRWQLVHQLMCTGRQWVEAVSYDPRFPAGLTLAIVRVPRDDEAIAKLAEAIRKADQEVEAVVAELARIRESA